MPTYKVRFARVVVAEKEFKAEDLNRAKRLASDMELRGELSIIKYVNGGEVVLSGDVVDIQDYEGIWEVEEASEPEYVSTTALAQLIDSNEKGGEQ